MSTMEAKLTKLSYSIREEKNFLIISFEGEMNKDSFHTLSQCHDAVAKNKSQFIIFDFSQVSKLDYQVVRPLVQFQLMVREKPAKIRICGLSQESENLLLNARAIRPDEIRPDLQTILEEP